MYQPDVSDDSQIAHGANNLPLTQSILGVIGEIAAGSREARDYLRAGQTYVVPGISQIGEFILTSTRTGDMVTNAQMLKGGVSCTGSHFAVSS